MEKPLLASLVLTVTLVSSAALAQIAVAINPNDPRANEINQRLINQQSNINQHVQNGWLNPKQAAHDQATDINIANQLSKDEAKHGGYITPAEQNHMNMELNRNDQRIYMQQIKNGKRPQPVLVIPSAP